MGIADPGRHTAPALINKEKMERSGPELKKLRYDPSKYKTYLEQLGIQYPPSGSSQFPL